MTSNADTPTNDIPDECNQDTGKGCSISSGTAHGDNSAAKETVLTPVSSSSDTEIKSNLDPDGSDDEPLVKKCMLLPKRCWSQEAIQRCHCLYKIRKRNRQQKYLKSPKKFEYRELTITHYFQ